MKKSSNSTFVVEKGQAIVLFALALVGLLAFVALALDGGMLWMVRGNQQSATDTAAYAGGLRILQTEEWQKLNDSAIRNIARAPAMEAAAEMGFENDIANNTVSVHYPPVNGPYINDKNYLQVVIETKVPTAFLQIVSPQVVKSTTEAVVHIKTEAGGQMLGASGTLIAADKTSCQSFHASNNAKVNVVGGGVFVNSNCKTGNGALYVTGSAEINIKTTGQSIAVIGSHKKDNNGKTNVEPKNGGTQMDFPDIEMPDCSDKTNFGSHSGDTNVLNRPSNYTAWQSNPYTLKPGNYPNGIKVANGMAANLLPGLYCVNGDVAFSGSKSITGNGVIFVMKGGNFAVDNGTNPFTVTAPGNLMLKTSTGKQLDFKGMLFLANPAFYTSAKTFTYAGGATTAVSGTFYAPKTNCVFNNGTNNAMYAVQVICGKITVAGGSGNNFKLSPNDVYQVPGGGGSFIELAQ